MKKSKIIYIIQGAGLSSPIAALLFVFTWNWLYFLLIPVGAGVGFLTGLIMTRKSPSTGSERDSRIGKVNVQPKTLGPLSRTFLNRSVIVRFASLLTLGCLLFILAWSVGYIILPEGAFRAGAEAHMARSSLDSASQTAVAEWIKILRVNFIPILLIIFSSLLIRINGVPLGYLVALYNLILYGLFVGTNSFAIPYADRLPPSLAILERSGPYEMTALLLLAAATGTWSFFQVKHLFRTIPERVIPTPEFHLSDFAAILLGIGLMMAANWREAVMIMSQMP